MVEWRCSLLSDWNNKLVVQQTISSTMFRFWTTCSFFIIPTFRHNIKDLSWNQINHNIPGGVTFLWWIYQKSALASKHFAFFHICQIVSNSAIFDFTCRSNCASAVCGSCREFRIAKRLHSCQSLEIFKEFSTFVSFSLVSLAMSEGDLVSKCWTQWLEWHCTTKF